MWAPSSTRLSHNKPQALRTERPTPFHFSVGCRQRCISLPTSCQQHYEMSSWLGGRCKVLWLKHRSADRPTANASALGGGAGDGVRPSLLLPPPSFLPFSGFRFLILVFRFLLSVFWLPVSVFRFPDRPVVSPPRRFLVSVFCFLFFTSGPPQASALFVSLFPSSCFRFRGPPGLTRIATEHLKGGLPCT